MLLFFSTKKNKKLSLEETSTRVRTYILSDVDIRGREDAGLVANLALDPFRAHPLEKLDDVTVTNGYLTFMLCLPVEDHSHLSRQRIKRRRDQKGKREGGREGDKSVKHITTS